MSRADNNTIQLKVSAFSPVVELYTSTSAITPGFLCDQNNNYSVIPAVDTLAAAEALFAVENPTQGGGIEDDYALGGSRVMLRSLRPGDEVLAWVAPNETYGIGTKLGSAGNPNPGTLTTASVLTDYVICICLAFNPTPIASAQRIPVRII